jgi:glutamyl-tRNA synthetase
MSSETNPSVRVRIAPSPTGLFNLATARNALYNWIFALKHNGTLILRIEDTDKERSTSAYDEDILNSMDWLGISYQELHRQNERTDIYKKYLEMLLEQKLAFYCPHTKEELEVELEAQKKNREPVRHICSTRDGSAGEGIIRFKNDATDPIIINDIVRGKIEFQPSLLGDFSLAKSPSEALYNFAVIVDDHEMKITHVIRGEDHISNTPKQILISQALGFSEPKWAHLPLLLGKDKSKLSKRHGGFSINEFKTTGYLPEAIVNFTALLGWHPAAKVGVTEKEILSREELVELFSLERIQKGGAIVDFEKLDWFNKEYLKILPIEDLALRAKEFISDEVAQKISTDKLSLIIGSARARITKLSELNIFIKETIEIKPYDKNVLLWKGKLDGLKVGEIIDELIKILSNLNADNFTQKKLEEELAPLVQKEGKGAVLWPLRTSLSGKEQSAGPYELSEILGKDEVMRRLEAAKRML